MSPVPAAVHVAAASSVHVPSVDGAPSVHGASSGAHVAPHGVAPGGAAQAGDGAAATAVVASVGEAAPEGRGRQEAAGGPAEAATGQWSCRRHTKLG